jgi:hypothetical protein
VSALAQLLELRGVPTVVIGLVRLHMEKVQPPRGVWTPFQLGRPLGEPANAAFQLRVLMQALGLFERTDGPVILEDFTDDPPNWIDEPGWRPPFSLPIDAPTENRAAWPGAVANEISLLASHWGNARARFGRTTVGLSCMPPEAWPEFMARFLVGELPSGPMPHLAAPALALRFAVDDLKAYYMEAAQSDGRAPASRQVDAWFWRQTRASEFLRALRTRGMESDNTALRTVSERFLVPGPWVAG